MNANCFGSFFSMRVYLYCHINKLFLQNNSVPIRIPAGMNVSVTSGNDSVNFSQTIFFDEENLQTFTIPDLLAAIVIVQPLGYI